MDLKRKSTLQLIKRQTATSHFLDFQIPVNECII
jgi:hypothetical protein